jgi:polar amino acid transport system permease protein
MALSSSVSTAEMADWAVRPARHLSRWVAAAVVLMVFGLLVRAFAQSSIQWGIVRKYFTTTIVIEGFLRTLQITAVSMLLAIVLGVIFAVMRMSKNPVTSGVAWLYVWFFRGTPILLQILLWFNLAVVFPRLAFPGIYSGRTIDVITPFIAGVLALGVNEGAYLTEVIRGGMLSVDEGQDEASTALGLSRLQALRSIILPQAMRVIIPPVGNETIGMLKTSSLVAVISFNELLGTVQQIYFVQGRVIELLFVAGAWYLVATSVLSIGQYYLERHLGRGLQRSRPRSTLENAILRLVGARRPSATRARS